MFWSRALLKENAKKVLSVSYWKVFGVCIISTILGGTLPLQAILRAYNDVLLQGHYWSYYRPTLFWLFLPLIASILVLLFVIFVGLPIFVGSNRYMMENRAGNPPFRSVFSVFKQKKQYVNVVKVMLLYFLEIGFWSLLFVIPGIYKTYQYYYVPYLLAENPYMSYSRAKELSRAMTENEKGAIFVLALSFLGWSFLSILVSSFVNRFVPVSFFGMSLTAQLLVPYIRATYAELYAAARAKAFSLNITGPEELADFARH